MFWAAAAAPPWKIFAAAVCAPTILRIDIVLGRATARAGHSAVPAGKAQLLLRSYQKSESCTMRRRRRRFPRLLQLVLLCEGIHWTFFSCKRRPHLARAKFILKSSTIDRLCTMYTQGAEFNLKCEENCLIFFFRLWLRLQTSCEYF